MICKSCKTDFVNPTNYLEILDRISPSVDGTKFKIPAPETCPDCRYQGRVLHRNEWNLYHRKCSATSEPIISIYTQDKTFPVYSQNYWWGDNWDAKSYGKDFDFSRPFFEQFAELQAVVPRLAIVNSESENCDYTNQSLRNKNCYFAVATVLSERCMYANWNNTCYDCVDCYSLEKCTACYECVNASNLYEAIFVSDSENCSNAYFSNDCKGCQYIFGCCGLRNKTYHIYNQPVTKEKWNEFVSALRLSEANIKSHRAKLNSLILSLPQKYYRGFQNEQISGDFIRNCHRCFNSFHLFNCEDVHYCQDMFASHNMLDSTEIGNAENSYSCEGGDFKSCFFVSKGWPLVDTMYSDLCYYSNNLFGCIGLKQSKYCVLNKQYDKESYFKLVKKIIAHMHATREWGQHLPAQYSPFGYNETIAQEYFPLTESEVKDRSWIWYPENDKPLRRNSESSPPELIEECDDSVLNRTFVCEISNKPYKITKLELEFYRKMKLPVPRRCFNQRRAERMARRNPRKLWSSHCMNNKAPSVRADTNGGCKNEFLTSFDPKKDYKIYCEDCYSDIFV